MKQLRTISLTVFVAMLFMAMSLASATAAKTKSDIENNTHRNSLLYMIDNGYMQGYGDGIYKPNNAVTRGQFSLILYRMLDLDPPTIQNEFKDIKDDTELAEAVNAIVELKILSGYDDKTFKPNEPIQRQHVAKIVSLTLNHYGKIETGDPINYADRASIYKDYLPAVDHVGHYGIVRGSTVDKVTNFKPRDTTTRGQAASILMRFHQLIEQQETKPEVPKEREGYALATIENGKLQFSDKTYATYQEAKVDMKANHVGISYVYGTSQSNVIDERLVYVKNGIGYANVVQGIVNVYENDNFTNALAYQESGREFAILDQTEKAIKVQVGDVVGYAKTEEVGLLPDALVSERDHYVVNTNGELVHKTQNYIRNNSAAYIVGAAPATLQSGKTYYSRDGVRFYSDPELKNFVTEHYPYFQYLSVRTPTTYTAEELNKFIMDALKDRESLNPRYKDATKKSKLIGLGEHLKKVESEHQVSALFILATAIHESDYGMSEKAQTINNIFGIRVTDSNPQGGTSFSTPKASVNAFISEYINKNYANPAGAYAKGAAPGNKGMGVNTHYASDPTWGAKVGSHMYRIDKALGVKDMNVHQRGIILSPQGVNVRTKPSTSSNVLYRYKAKHHGASNEAGYPIVILKSEKQEDGHVWHLIQSDLTVAKSKALTGWVRGDLIKLISND